MKKRNVAPTLIALGFGVAVSGCGGSSSGDVGQPMAYQHAGDTTTYNPATTGLAYSAASTSLTDATVDYMLALRTASLKLRGNLPTLDEQKRLQNVISNGSSDDAQILYESLVRSMIWRSASRSG